MAARSYSSFHPRLVLLVVCLAGGRADAAEEAKGPLSPSQSLSHFRLEAGLTIEVVAAEPAVVDPIDVRFDEDGRMWVVEMRDYPHGPPEGQPPLSRIRVLEDEDGDGRFETARTFAEELLFPTGLLPWRGGAIVTLAGEVAYLKDTDGDGRADLRETWFRGFATENPQLRANHPRFAPDGRIYIANGLRGGVVVDPRRANAAPLDISGRDFCFDPRSGMYEAVSGNGQFGLTFDDFGNRFVCSNRQPLDHVVLENRYLARNPFLAVSAVVNSVASAGESSRVFPLTSAWTTSNLHAGQFTAACGTTIYRGDGLGDGYDGNAFVCEPTGSLVHREIVKPDGATFTAQPAHADEEFLASTDAWFRPVNLEIGPDGGLYVVDMYRAVIEHPQFMPDELQQRPDLRLGDDRGRIYRVRRTDASQTPRPRLSRATTSELAAALAHKNAWWRETAARLLYERNDPAVTRHVERVAETSDDPAVRVGALQALAACGAATAGHVERALEDRDPRARQQAVALAEPMLGQDRRLAERVIALAADEDDGVRFRVALAIGGMESPDAIGPLAAIALARPDDGWTRAAVSTARAEHIAPLLVEVLRVDRVRAAAYDAAEQDLVRELATMVGARQDRAEVARLLGVVTADDAAAVPAFETALLGLADGLARRGADLVDFARQLPDAEMLNARLDAAFSRAARAALDEQLAERVRAARLDLLQHARSVEATRVCLSIVEQSPSQELRVRAAAALARHRGEMISAALLAGYSAQTPVVRRAILDALVVQPARAMALLEAVRDGRIARAELDSSRESRLRQHRDADVQKLAKEILTTAVPAERKAVLADYRAALALDGDPERGRELFRQHCAVCHKIAGIGVDVAPDISDSRVKTPEQLLTDILNPNQAIDNNYVSYTIATVDGNVYTGIIAAETAGSITLRQQENKTVSLLRGDIEAIQTSGVSLMPEGFEKHLSQQQMADVIAFVKNWRYLDEPIPGTIGTRGKP